MDRARAAPSAKPTKSGFIGLEASGPFTYPRGLQAPDDFDSSSVPGASADKGPSGPVGGADKERNHRPGGIWVPDGQPLPPGAELSSGTTLGLHAQRQGAVRTNLQRPPSSTRAAFVGRFHNTMIRSDGQLLLATRYCLRNSLELGIDITTYPWSSYASSIGESWQSDLTKVDAKLPIELAGGTGAFRHFVESDRDFDRFPLSAGGRCVRGAPYRSVEESLAELCQIVATATGRSSVDLITPVGSACRQARFVAILLAHDYGLGSPDEIREFFKLRARSTLRSVVSAATTRSEIEPQFKALLEQARFSWCSTESTPA